MRAEKLASSGQLANMLREKGGFELLYDEAIEQFLQGNPLSEDVSDTVDFDFPLFSEDEDKILLDGLAKAADVGGVWHDMLELRAPSSSSLSGPDPAKIRVSKRVIEC